MLCEKILTYLTYLSDLVCEINFQMAWLGGKKSGSVYQSCSQSELIYFLASSKSESRELSSGASNTSSKS
jgi:hypothetical protein